MTTSPSERFARWFATRDDQPRNCGYGSSPGHEYQCDAIVTRRDSRAEGHEGFCSDEHRDLASIDAAI